MANLEHLGMLFEGVEVWNLWRNENLDIEPNIKPNLQNANLQNANLQNANFQNTNLQEANLQNTNLQEANLQNANLQEANLQDINLTGANLQNANLQEANLTGANLRGTNLQGASLYWANLTGVLIDEETQLDHKWRLVWKIINEGAEGLNLSRTNLEKVNFRKVDFQGANLQEANLQNANLQEANLTGANLRGTNLQGASLYWANLTGVFIDEETQLDHKWRLVWKIVNEEDGLGFIGADFDGVDLQGSQLQGVDFSGSYFLGANLKKINLTGSNLQGSDLNKADLAEANLTEANLTGADLEEANLSSSNLSGANLSGVDLTGANLTGANLYWANLQKANLTGANLTGANLYWANLQGSFIDEKTQLDNKWQLVWEIVNEGAEGLNLLEVNLTGANLTGTDFEEANLTRTNFQRAILKGADFRSANFKQSTLTGACIEDWNINSKTNFEGVKCDYVYLKSRWDRNIQKVCLEERRPHDSNKIFAPGDFERLVRKAQETIDLIFRNGVDWLAFLNSYEQLKVEAGGDFLPIQAIENKGDGSFVVRIQTPPELDKGQIQKSFETKYKRALKIREQQYREKLNAKDREIEIYREQNTNLWEMVKLKASQPINIHQQQGDSIMSGDSYTQSGNFGIGHMSGGNINEGAKVAGIINEVGNKSLAEAATEIQQLLDQLCQTYSPAEAEQKVAEDLANKAKQDPSFKQQLKSWSQSLLGKGSETAVTETVKEGVKRVIPLAISFLI